VPAIDVVHWGQYIKKFHSTAVIAFQVRNGWRVRKKFDKSHTATRETLCRDTLTLETRRCEQMSMLNFVIISHATQEAMQW